MRRIKGRREGRFVGREGVGGEGMKSDVSVLVFDPNEKPVNE